MSDSQMEKQIKTMVTLAVFNEENRKQKIERAERNTRYCFLPIDATVGMKCVTVADVNDAIGYNTDYAYAIQEHTCNYEEYRKRFRHGVITRIDTETGFHIKCDDGTEAISKVVMLQDMHTNNAFTYKLFDHEFMREITKYWNGACRSEDDPYFTVMDAYDTFINGTETGDCGAISCYYHIYGDYVIKGNEIVE